MIEIEVGKLVGKLNEAKSELPFSFLVVVGDGQLFSNLCLKLTSSV